jgi:hypothetical protein
VIQVKKRVKSEPIISASPFDVGCVTVRIQEFWEEIKRSKQDQIVWLNLVFEHIHYEHLADAGQRTGAAAGACDSW